MSKLPVIQERGCGNPRQGKIYLTMEFSEFGTPFKHFITDPVAPIPAGITIKPRGMSLVEIGGRKYIVDHIGSTSYPNPADFIEEVGRLGLHQLIERSFPFNQITPDMWILFTHSSALISDSKMLMAYNKRDGRFNDPDHELLNMPCPNKDEKIFDAHMEFGNLASAEGKMCAGLHWSALQMFNQVDEDDNMVTRTMPSFQYRGRAYLDGTDFLPGIILALPVSALGFKVYENTMTNEHEAALGALDELPAELKERVELLSLQSTIGEE